MNQSQQTLISLLHNSEPKYMFPKLTSQDLPKPKYKTALKRMSQ